MANRSPASHNRVAKDLHAHSQHVVHEKTGTLTNFFWSVWVPRSQSCDQLIFHSIDNDHRTKIWSMLLRIFDLFRLHCFSCSLSLCWRSPSAQMLPATMAIKRCQARQRTADRIHKDILARLLCQAFYKHFVPCTEVSPLLAGSGSVKRNSVFSSLRSSFETNPYLYSTKK